MPDITKISHGLTIGDLKFGNARPGIVEATLKPGETLEEALDELDERLTAWHRKRYPHLYQEGGKPDSGLKFYTTEQVASATLLSVNGVPVIDKSAEKIEIAIDNATTLEELNKIKDANPVLPYPILLQLNTKMEILRVEANNKSMGEKNSK